MTDREMLELAAKAHGKEIDLDRYDDEMGFIILGISRWWNPLTNDGDAFRLAVRLEIDLQNTVLPTDNTHPVNSKGQGVAYLVNGSYERIVEWYTDGDAVAATRRAITRAAAAIQEAKEGA